MKNVAAAEKLAALSEVNGGGLAAGSAQLLWFYNNVKADAPMDYKNPIIWKKALSGLPYPEEDKVYHVFGYDISSSDLGNLNYALVGKALGIPEKLLLQQAGAAQLRDHEKMKFFKSQRESFRLDDYGDTYDDQEMIGNGFDVYKSLF
ncbi:MAG: polymorphic toxin type 44 domain-containing protein [Eubacteriales bacterium]|nr:polymorphic toxin type 44 domain-containing protein [Eubacteriales bacterium]